MNHVDTYLRKKVLVLGLAKSGVAAARLLHKLGAFVTVNDMKPLWDNANAQELLEEGITVICGSHPVELLDEGIELVVKNPGIPYNNPMIQKALEKEIPIITEVELAYEISEADFIAITGTNGKTTTTTLIFEMLQAGGKNPLIAGNIGTVACEVAESATKENIIVIEMSSFQLMGIQKFRPHIAIMTNLFDAHLDYHGTRKEYLKAKMNVVKNQRNNDYFIYNGRQSELKEVVGNFESNLIPFSIDPAYSDQAFVKDGFIIFQGERIVDISKIILPGDHSLENILCAVSASKLVGVSNQAIESVLMTFKGVKHRFQFVKELKGRKFYNDSKATNIVAASKALEAFKTSTILLAGGLDRGNEFDDLIPYLKQVRVLVTFGQTAPKLARVARDAGIESILVVENVEAAVPAAFEVSNEGEVILLSPACASWDQYRDFEVRGDIFVRAVNNL
ncbi:MAG: murD [Bacillales bacterium]|jgi:UDP-N-acetylmuramoylalanine--D-glutamate ligase|nr:murD [Bacillales bacterium]